MADRFAQAMLQKAEAPYRGGEGRNLARAGTVADDQAELDEYERAQPAAGETMDDESEPEADSPETDPDHDRPAIEPNDWPTPDAVATAEREDAAPSTGQRDVTFDDGAADDGPETDAGPTTDDHADAESTGAATRTAGATPGTREAVVGHLRGKIRDLPDLSRRMLAHYRVEREADPVDAHVAAGGTPERPMAYGRNRPLRTGGFVEHVTEDRYRYALPDRVAEAFDGHLDDATLDEVVREVEEAFVDEETLADEAADVRVPDERDEVEVVDDDVDGDDGFVDEDAVFVESGGETPASADHATRQQMASGNGSEDGEPTSQTDAEIL
jgi:hypothetical protein